MSDSNLWEMKLNNYTTIGEIISIACDEEHYRMIYIMTKDGATINLYGFTRNTLYILNTLVHSLMASTKIIPFFSPAVRTEFILYNKD